jgi:hypothetical protein
VKGRDLSICDTGCVDIGGAGCLDLVYRSVSRASHGPDLRLHTRDLVAVVVAKRVRGQLRPLDSCILKLSKVWVQWRCVKLSGYYMVLFGVVWRAVSQFGVETVLRVAPQPIIAQEVRSELRERNYLHILEPNLLLSRRTLKQYTYDDLRCCFLCS